MGVPAWVSAYIGLPFLEHGRTDAGLDCWGLVRLVYERQFGIALPSFATDYGSTVDVQTIAQLVAGEQKHWSEVPPADVACGDVILLRVRGLECHVGIVLEEGKFLHVIKGANCCIESYKSLLWRKRVSGFWRYSHAS